MLLLCWVQYPTPMLGIGMCLPPAFCIDAQGGVRCVLFCLNVREEMKDEIYKKHIGFFLN